MKNSVESLVCVARFAGPPGSLQTTPERRPSGRYCQEDLEIVNSLALLGRNPSYNCKRSKPLRSRRTVYRRNFVFGQGRGAKSFEPRGTEGGLLRFWRCAGCSFSDQRAAKLHSTRRDNPCPLCFVNHANAQRSRLFELRTRARPSHHQIGFRTD